ncbi:MAG TPA: hypothetical protein VJT75_01495 [Thermoleophilaceae bacterium]|nr:hypothetical protein [Thermoleophilaceae bacterium]
MSSQPHRIVVVANETVGGRALIDKVKECAEESHSRGEPFHVTVVCPQNQPKSGYVIYEDSVRTAAENRLATTLAQLREIGIDADGEVMDPDPYSATMDAIGAYGADEVIVSTHPDTRSGWLRRDLIDRLKDDTGLPIHHVVVDLDADRKHVTRTLVVANQTVGGGPLIELLKKKGAEEPHNFVVIMPQGGNEEGDPHGRLAHTLELLHDAGLEAVGQVMDPDPFTAVQNALQFYPADEIVVSTFPGERSGWLRSQLIERIKASTSKPVEHVEVSPEQAREGATA